MYDLLNFAQYIKAIIVLLIIFFQVILLLVITAFLIITFLIFFCLITIIFLVNMCFMIIINTYYIKYERKVWEISLKKWKPRLIHLATEKYQGWHKSKNLQIGLTCTTAWLLFIIYLWPIKKKFRRESVNLVVILKSIALTIYLNSRPSNVFLFSFCTVYLLYSCSLFMSVVMFLLLFVVLS